MKKKYEVPEIEFTKLTVLCDDSGPEVDGPEVEEGEMIEG